MLRNTPTRYGSIAKSLHWLTALLFVCVYLSVYYRHWFTDTSTPENWTALHLHLSFGVSIGVFFGLRIVWRLTNPHVTAMPTSRIQHRLATSGHVTLYVVMLLMPLTGYLGTGVDTEFFGLFNIPNFKDSFVFQNIITPWLQIDFKTFEQPIDFLHKDVGGKWLVWLLILGHISAAFYHHYVLRDDTLNKMLPSAIK